MKWQQGVDSVPIDIGVDNRTDEDKYHHETPLSLSSLYNRLILFLRSTLSSFTSKDLKSFPFLHIFQWQSVFYCLYCYVFYRICMFVLNQSFENNNTQIMLSRCVVSVIALLFVWRVNVPKSHPFCVSVVAALTTNIFVEAARNEHITKETYTDTLCCNSIVFLLYIPGMLGFWFSKYYVIFVTAMLELFGTAQFYSDLFRGNPLRPVDLLSFRSMLGMREDYSLNHPRGITLIVLACANLICITRCALNKNVHSCSKYLRYVLSAIGLGIVFVFVTQIESIVKAQIQRNAVIIPRIVMTYSNVGSVYAFYIDHAVLSVQKKPEGYSAAESKEILSQFEPKPTGQEKLRKPHIIAIVSESFADYAVFDNVKIGKDYMPFMRHMQNAVKGYVSVSVFGSTTCNSEYEFLTGNSMGMYPYMSSAYVRVVNNRQEALTYILNNYGYNTIATAACKGTIWNVASAYDMFRFNETFYADEFYRFSEMYNRRPKDRAVFEGVKRLFEERHKDHPLFFFITTMQNHSPYPKTKDSDYRIPHFNNGKLNTYLNGLKMTDEAIGDLVRHFSHVKEDVVIVFFGDHHPLIPSFTDKLFGCDLEHMPLEKKSKMYMTPFFIWANYPIESENANFSLTYLSSKVMDIAGFPRTAYQNFLADTKKHIPLITPFTYMDENGEWQWLNDDTHDPYLDRYHKVQYYMIHDNDQYVVH